jgi:hypothetical protein
MKRIPNGHADIRCSRARFRFRFLRRLFRRRFVDEPGIFAAGSESLLTAEKKFERKRSTSAQVGPGTSHDHGFPAASCGTGIRPQGPGGNASYRGQRFSVTKGIQMKKFTLCALLLCAAMIGCKEEGKGGSGSGSTPKTGTASPSPSLPPATAPQGS